MDDHGEAVGRSGWTASARHRAERAPQGLHGGPSDATTTRALAVRVAGAPTELASFDPFFSFFLGGVAILVGGDRVGAVGVSGLAGEADERLALDAIAAAGLQSPS